jgi:hypothetical protein
MPTQRSDAGHQVRAAGGGERVLAHPARLDEKR